MTTDPLTVQKNAELFKERRNRQWIVTIPMVVLVFGLIWFRDHPGSGFESNRLYESQPAALSCRPA